ncbi:unnamed protein product, partial [Ilex paraguariensis]
ALGLVFAILRPRAHTKQISLASPPTTGTGSYKRAKEADPSGGGQRKNDPHMKSIKAKNVICEQ